MRSAVQITPTFSPDISGVGDYAALLARVFDRSGAPLQTSIVQPDAWSGEGATSRGRADASEVAALLRGTECVLLHFSGYGYARRGICRWLVDGLAQWQAAVSHHHVSRDLYDRIHVRLEELDSETQRISEHIGASDANLAWRILMPPFTQLGRLPLGLSKMKICLSNGAVRRWKKSIKIFLHTPMNGNIFKQYCQDFNSLRLLPVLIIETS